MKAPGKRQRPLRAFVARCACCQRKDPHLWKALLNAEGECGRPKLELVDWSQIRGRTFKRNYIIADEATNETKKLLELLVERVDDNEGTRSKLVIIGSPEQFDNSNPNFSTIDRGKRISVLEWLAERLESV